MMWQSLTEADIARRLREAEHPTFHEKPFEQFSGPMRRAAVLLPLLRMGDDWHVLFTRRADTVEHHKGQVSFPGGRADPDDATLVDTALRETEEEIGVPRAQVRVLGSMGEYLTVTNYLVTPVVGVLPWPVAFKIHTQEVGRVFTMPLTWLGARDNRYEFLRVETGRGLIAFLPYDGELLWGATARMMVHFLELFQEK